jgi:hypothetical protein
LSQIHVLDEYGASSAICRAMPSDLATS